MNILQIGGDDPYAAMWLPNYVSYPREWCGLDALEQMRRDALEVMRDVPRHAAAFAAQIGGIRATYSFVEADDYLSPQQRIAALADILSNIALRVMKEQKGDI